MLELIKNLLGKPVMSLRSGGQIAIVQDPIINPNNLKIEGFYCADQINKGSLVLLTQDIRDIMSQGFAVNDYEVLAKENDLIRLKKIISINFELTGKPVFTDNNKKLGKVVEYAVETQSMYIKKLYVSQSLLKSLDTSQLSVDRNQIIEVTNKKIVIQDPLQLTRAAAPVTS